MTLIIFSHMWTENVRRAFRLRTFLRLWRRKKTLELNRRRGRQLHSYSLSKKKWVFDKYLTTRVFDRLIFHPSVIDKHIYDLRHLIRHQIRINQFQITLMFYFKTLRLILHNNKVNVDNQSNVLKWCLKFVLCLIN